MRMRVRRLLLAAALFLSCSTALHAQHESVRRGDVSIEYWPEQRALAASLLRSTHGIAFPGIPADILDRDSIIHVVLAPDEARFGILTGGRAPEWGAGVAMPQAGIVVLPAYPSSRGNAPELPTVLRHELAHVALQRHLGNALVPRWFTEGYATWTAGQFDADAGWQLRLALASDRAPSLDSLTLHWPLLEADARLAYLLSASAVTHLHSLGTPAMFERFLQAWAVSGDMERSLRTVYLVTGSQHERLWRAHVRRTYGWLQVAVQSLFLWAIAAVLIVFLYIVRRRRNRGRMERLREHEEPDEPAYWTEVDPEPGDAGAAGDDGPTPSADRPGPA